MTTNTIEDPDFNILKRQFLNFLEQHYYTDEIESAIAKGKNRILIGLNDLRTFDISLAQALINAPIKHLPPLEEALLELANTKRVDLKRKGSHPLSIKAGFEGSFGPHLVVPRKMNSALLTKMICVEGIVTKLSMVRPKRFETVHFCEKTKNFSSFMYRDATSFDQAPTGSSIPVKDSEGNPLSLEFGYSTYVDYQKIFVQDMPERSAAGQMPRTVEVVAERDLVDNCKAGDRVQIVGVYRALAWKTSGMTNGMYRTVLIANNIKVISQISNSQLMTENDIKNIRKISKKKNLLSYFSKSVAHTLYGHEMIKKAIVLLLLGGEEKVLENKTHIRGDINMLLMGDPSVGKSQLLRAIMQIAKLSVSTTGRGSTGVGLTAAVLKDRDSGDRYLEAGATVLADRGVICIDEFDKMSEIDRTAIHEVMEQQTVTIAKAGIHTSLNARCSVVAAANPAYSSYDPSKTPQQNIPLPDSILSRFDVLFVVLDKLDPESDRKITDHVLKMHRYKRSGKEGDIYERTEEVDDDEETPVFEQIENSSTHLPFLVDSNFSKNKREKKEFLSLEFIKKYFDFAKTNFHPVLTKSAVTKIAEAYSLIRNSEESTALPITARYVETIIRFATAHAKLRLSERVEEKDVTTVLQILQYSLNNDAQTGRSTMDNEEVEFSGNSEAGENDSVDGSAISKNKKRKAETKTMRKMAKKQTLGASEKKSEIRTKTKLRGKAEERKKDDNEKGRKAETNEKRKKTVMGVVSKIAKDGEAMMDEVLKVVNERNIKMKKAELREILADLEEMNRVMVVDETIHLI